MSKTLGLTGAVTIDGRDYQIESIDYKIEVEENSYTPIGSHGWERQCTGGCKKLTGTFEFPFDSALVTDGGDGTTTFLMSPFTDTLVPMVININATTVLSFSAYVKDISGDKKSKGIHKVKCSFVSDNIPTYTVS